MGIFWTNIHNHSHNWGGTTFTNINHYQPLSTTISHYFSTTTNHHFFHEIEVIEIADDLTRFRLPVFFPQDLLAIHRWKLGDVLTAIEAVFCRNQMWIKHENGHWNALHIMCIYIIYIYIHPGVDRILKFKYIHWNVWNEIMFENPHILSTSGWLYIYIIHCIYTYS